MFAVINTSTNDQNIGLIGRVESLHRTAAAALAKDAKAQRACRRANGSNTWIPQTVVNLGDNVKSKGENVYRDEVSPLD